MNQTITLTIGSKDFTFNVSTNDYNGYINDIMPNNKVAPAHNLVMRTVDESNKKELRELVDKSPGAVLQIAGLLQQEFAPVLEISVKK